MFGRLITGDYFHFCLLIFSPALPACHSVVLSGHMCMRREGWGREEGGGGRGGEGQGAGPQASFCGISYPNKNGRFTAPRSGKHGAKLSLRQNIKNSTYSTKNLRENFLSFDH